VGSFNLLYSARRRSAAGSRSTGSSNRTACPTLDGTLLPAVQLLPLYLGRPMALPLSTDQPDSQRLRRLGGPWRETLRGPPRVAPGVCAARRMDGRPLLAPACRLRFAAGVGDRGTAPERRHHRAGFVLVLGPLLGHQPSGESSACSGAARRRCREDSPTCANVVQRLSAWGCSSFSAPPLPGLVRARFLHGRPEPFAQNLARDAVPWPDPDRLRRGVLGIAYHLANGLWSFTTMGWGVT